VSDLVLRLFHGNDLSFECHHQCKRKHTKRLQITSHLYSIDKRKGHQLASRCQTCQPLDLVHGFQSVRVGLALSPSLLSLFERRQTLKQQALLDSATGHCQGSLCFSSSFSSLHISTRSSTALCHSSLSTRSCVFQLGDLDTLLLVCFEVALVA